MNYSGSNLTILLIEKKGGGRMNASKSDRSLFHLNENTFSKEFFKSSQQIRYVFRRKRGERRTRALELNLI